MTVPVEQIVDAFAFDVEHLYATGRMILCGPPNQVTTNVLIAAFAVYFRNVYDFLYKPTKGKYYRAMHVVKDASLWEKHRGDVGQVVKRVYDRKANQEVVHIGQDRINLASDDRPWPVGALLAELAPAIILLAQDLPKRQETNSVVERLAVAIVGFG